MSTLLYKIKKVALKGVLITSPLVGAWGLSSCSDWDDHYDEGDTSNNSIWEQLTNNPQLSDFMDVIQAVNVTRQNRVTTTSYAEMLQGGRTLTVFAPVNGSFDKDAIIKAVETNSGDSAMEKTFVENNLISDVWSFVDGEGQVRKQLMNKHYASFSPYENAVNGVSVLERNIACKNGVIHIMSKPLPYLNTIYEALTNESDFYQADDATSSGSILRSYNKQEFDEKNSTANGMEEGVTVFIDSVTYETNRMLDSLGCKIKAIDSTYIVTIPTMAGWKTAFAKAMSAYNYPKTTTDRDSIQKAKAFRALMDDATFSMTTINSRQRDSIVSVKYNPKSAGFDSRYHVFKNPYKPGGILYDTLKTIQCCNGTIYAMRDWSLGAAKTYHKQIEVEGETFKAHDTPIKVTTSNQIIADSAEIVKTLSPFYATAPLDEYKPDKGTSIGDSISKGNFVIFRSKKGPTTNWSATYRITGTLSAKYDIKVVLLPFNVISGPESTTLAPTVFTACINYIDEDGKTCHKKADNMYFKSNAYRVDTITVFKDFEFPACNNDGTTNDNVSLTLETTYVLPDRLHPKTPTTGCVTTMYLDEILLTPKED